MTREEKIANYQSIVGQVTLVAEHLAELDLPSILRDIERAETLGPFLDPTLARQKWQAMMEDKELLEAALPLSEMGLRVKDELQRRKEAKP